MSGRKKDYFNQDNQRLKAELERACDKLEVERKKVRELEREIGMREMLKTTGRQAELDAMQNMLNRNKELEAQLAQAQAACVEHERIILKGFKAQGWLSPDEAKKSEEQKELYRQETHRWKAACQKSDDEAKALQAKIAAYDKQWNEMNFTICKLEQDLRKAKGEQ